MIRHASTRVVDASTGIAPFLKWIGGKRWLVRHGVAVPVLRPGATYFEPFAGAGSLYFALAPEKAVLADVNRQLMWAYAGVRNHAESVIKRLEGMENTQSFFDQMKAANPRSPIDRAARFIYLNRTAYGGVYRVNQKGAFNVPFGNYSGRLICQADVLRACSKLLKSATLRCDPFDATVLAAQEGDFVYFDPPYTLEAASERSMFNRYHRRMFTWEMHQQLAESARVLSAKGVFVLVSNTAHPAVAELYGDFVTHTIKRRSQLSRDPLTRGYAEEALYANYSPRNLPLNDERSQRR